MYMSCSSYASYTTEYHRGVNFQSEYVFFSQMRQLISHGIVYKSYLQLCMYIVQLLIFRKWIRTKFTPILWW